MDASCNCRVFDLPWGVLFNAPCAKRRCKIVTDCLKVRNPFKKKSEKIYSSFTFFSFVIRLDDRTVFFFRRIFTLNCPRVIVASVLFFTPLTRPVSSDGGTYATASPSLLQVFLTPSPSFTPSAAYVSRGYDKTRQLWPNKDGKERESERERARWRGQEKSNPEKCDILLEKSRRLWSSKWGLHL